jgi:hypothetical protein
MGAVEYLGPDDAVKSIYTADTLLEMYQKHCAAHDIEVLDLID